MRSIFLILVMAASCFSAYMTNTASGRFRDSVKVDSLRNSVGIGTDSAGKFIKSDSTRACSIADSAKVVGLIVHGVTPGTVPKAATDSTFTNSHISENGDTTKIVYPETATADTFTVYTDSATGYENSGALAYGGGTYVNMGWGARDFRTSTDGITWTDSYDADVSYPYFTGMCYGLGVFVAVSDGENGYEGVRKTATSSDGLSWSSQTSINNNQWQSVTFGGDTFVAVSSTGSGNRVMTSINGVDWTSRSSASDDDWYGVAYGEGVFVAVSRSGTYGSMVSSNGGITWATSRLQAYYWHDIIYGNGQFIAVADDSCAISNNGYAWTGVALPEINESVTGVAYGDGRIVIIYGNDDGMETYSFAWSTDGGEWNPVVVSPNRYWREIVYDGSRFVAVENVPDHSMIIDFDGQPDTPTVFLVSGGNSNFVGKVAIKNTPTTTTGTRVMIKNPEPDNEIKQITVENFVHAMGKVDSAAVADSARVAGATHHNVTPGQIPMSNGATTFRNTGTTVDSTTGDIHFYGKLILGDTLYTSVPGMVEGHGNQSDVDKDSLMVSLAAAPAGDKRRGGAFRAFGNEASPANGNVVMESGDSGDALIGGKEIYIHVDHPSDTSSLGVPVFKNDVRIGRDDVLPDDTDRVAIYLGRGADSSCGRIYGGKGASSTKATIELGNNANNKITISADTVRIVDRLETILVTSTLGVIDTFDVGLMRVGGGSNIIDIHRRTDTLVIKLSATDSLCFKAVAP